VRKRESTAPSTFFFLVLPSGISSGFASITLPFILTRAGFSVAMSASIVALGVSANLWRFLWGPVADLTLTARRWYLIGLSTTAVTLLALAVIPLHQNAAGTLMIVVFISQVASTLVMLPLGGLMAHTVGEEFKGRAAGWYQGGNLGGNGIGGGAGVWIAAHFSKEAAGWTLALAMLACALALYFTSDVRIVTTESFGQRMRLLGHDLLAIVRSTIPLFVTVLVCSPIGAGAMNNVWSAVAPDWRASPDMVALVTGVLNGVIAAVGCVAGGWIADRCGIWWAYFGSGIAIALVASAMAILPRTPNTFSFGVLTYAFTNGVAYAAFSAIVLVAIGRGAASTKYATLCSVGNLPVVYMTAIDGWVHDRFSTAWMLHTDALSGVICIVFALVVFQKINAARRAASRPV
jgi:MFS transporter, PAT family, beta-lactamase induction signal transducer AmpG